MIEKNIIVQGHCLDVLKKIPDESIDMCVTSPPYYGLRDYGHDDQIGLEKSPEEYTENLVNVFREVKRVLKNDGTLWLNLGDSYCSTAPGTNGDALRQSGIFSGVKEGASQAFKKYRPDTPKGLKPKDLIGIPWRIAFTLQQDGWWLRQDIIWHKPNPMPESVRDRCTKSHEHIFLLSKSQRYYYDNEAIKEPLKESSISRLNQNIDNQQGSLRIPGETNGSMKAVGPRPHGIVRDRLLDYNSKEKAMGKSVNNRGLYKNEYELPYPEETINKKSVWTVATKPYKEAHFATFPVDLIIPCIKAGCPEGGIVLDPFFGSGTTGEAALKLDRNFYGIELNPEYINISNKRLEPYLDQGKLF